MKLKEMLAIEFAPKEQPSSLISREAFIAGFELATHMCADEMKFRSYVCKKCHTKIFSKLATSLRNLGEEETIPYLPEV